MVTEGGVERLEESNGHIGEEGIDCQLRGGDDCALLFGFGCIPEKREDMGEGWLQSNDGYKR